MRKVFTLLLLFCSNIIFAQTGVTISGIVKDSKDQSILPFVNVTLHQAADTTFVSGSISTEEGVFTITDVNSGNYFLKAVYLGYDPVYQPILVGRLSDYLDVGVIALTADNQQLEEVVVASKKDAVSASMEKKTFAVADNVSQAGGSVLDAMKNLPGITVGQDGKVEIRGNDKVVVLMDGKQTALTGFGNQSGLDNIPASAIEKIEIINNPSSKYDANGNAGIINIVYKKEKRDGLTGKVGLAGGLGALWIKKESLPNIRPQYRYTPKLNPSLSINYRKGKTNLFIQVDDLYTQTLNKNEFVDRYYDNGIIVKQQTVRNRTTNLVTGRAGMDWYADKKNTFTISGLYSREKILDRGDEPFYNGDLSVRNRLWQFLEDEVKTTVTATVNWEHKFTQPGRVLNTGFNYTFHREDEQYFFTNVMPVFTGLDSFKLLSDEHVGDFTLDYTQPLRSGKIEGGLKLRRREIPIDMMFKPGLNSPLDTNAGGYAKYNETISAAYFNYVLETAKFEVEAGLRAEYAGIVYDVNPNHNTYQSDGYSYVQPFPNVRIAYKLSSKNKLSFFFTRRVDRPNEVDIRIFPKYDDAEIIKVGNPALQPQFANSFELGNKTSWQKGYLYSAAYHKIIDGTITRIASTAQGSTFIYNIFQNAGRSYNTGLEIVLTQQLSKRVRFDLNLLGYKNIIEAYSVENLYPVRSVFTAQRQDMYSGNAKLNMYFKLPANIEAQLTGIYLAPDIIPQGRIEERFSIDLGMKKKLQKGKGEIFLNATDVANTLRIKTKIQGDGFNYTSANYYETQVVRVGYTYKF